MKLLRAFLGNHVLANLTFLLVLLGGLVSYLGLPREQDPTINFNWIQITTAVPGASAEDVLDPPVDLVGVLETAVVGVVGHLDSSCCSGLSLLEVVVSVAAGA